MVTAGVKRPCPAVFCSSKRQRQANQRKSAGANGGNAVVLEEIRRLDQRIATIQASQQSLTQEVKVGFGRVHEAMMRAHLAEEARASFQKGIQWQKPWHLLLYLARFQAAEHDRENWADEKLIFLLDYLTQVRRWLAAPVRRFSQSSLSARRPRCCCQVCRVFEVAVLGVAYVEHLQLAVAVCILQLWFRAQRPLWCLAEPSPAWSLISFGNSFHFRSVPAEGPYLKLAFELCRHTCRSQQERSRELSWVSLGSGRQCSAGGHCQVAGWLSHDQGHQPGELHRCGCRIPCAL